jgi:hypothetical protein
MRVIGDVFGEECYSSIGLLYNYLFRYDNIII